MHKLDPRTEIMISTNFLILDRTIRDNFHPLTKNAREQIRERHVKMHQGYVAPQTTLEVITRKQVSQVQIGNRTVIMNLPVPVSEFLGYDGQVEGVYMN